MRRVITVALLVFLSLSIQASPQAPAEETNGSIEGTVARSDNGEPVAGAQVQFMLMAYAVPPAQPLTAPRPRPQPVVTDTDGKFTLKDLVAGEYRIAATANGFVRQELGQRTVTSQGRSVFVAAGQTLKDATIRLTATGTVGGRIFDENGQPATGAPVQLYRSVYTVQGRSLEAVNNAVSADDRGEYRLFGVPPGRYYLLAGTPPESDLGLRNSASFWPLYYPNVGNVEDALIVEIKSGEQTSVDMKLRRQLQSYRARGRLVDGTGAGLPANPGVVLSNQSGARGIRAYDPATGTFEIQGLSPGNYTLVISAPYTAPRNQIGPGPPSPAAEAEQASRVSGAVAIKIVDKDVDGLVIILSAGVNATGRISIEGQPLSAISNFARGGFELARLTNIVNQHPPVVFPPAADGSFQVVALREEEYHVYATAPPGFYVKSITYGGEDILNKPLKFSGTGSESFEVVLRSGTAQIQGVVTDAKSQAIAGTQAVLVPAQRTRVELYRSAVTDRNGRFVIANMPPGEYKLFSWEAIENWAPYDPAILKEYDQQGTAIRVTEGSNLNVDVKLIPAP